MAVTIRDIAKRLNLSHSTVSRIINNRDSSFISTETRARVRQTAEELGYRPNYHARSLQTGKACVLGLVLEKPEPNSEDRFWQSMLNGISTGARSRGYDLLIIGPAREQSEIERGLEYVTEHRVDALVIPGYLGSLDQLSSQSSDAPIVLAGNSASNARHPVVDLDAAPGIEAAVDHLAELGHRRLLWFDVEREGNGSVDYRRAAFRKAITRRALKGVEASMNLESRLNEERTVELSRRHFPEALARLPDATGVICYNEPTAFGVYAAAADRGLRVPRDLSVIGFDDIHAAVAAPSMTVVSHMLYAIGMKAAELAIALSETPATSMKKSKSVATAPIRELIPAELIVRQSTAAPQRTAGPIV